MVLSLIAARSLCVRAPAPAIRAAIVILLLPWPKRVNTRARRTIPGALSFARSA